MFLSIMGMYEYDNSIFDGLSVPNGISKNNVINEICMQCAELELMYPSFDTMKLAVKIWSESNKYTWDKLYKTTQLTYNPIWNVDAHETETFKQDKNNVLKYNSTAKTTYDSTDTESVKGFNSSSWSEARKNDYDGSDKTDHTGSDAATENTNYSIIKDRGGNIGVTTTQKMITEERDIASFNMINYIAMSFKERFCLLIY